jgi:hypothetical protein
MQLGVLLLLQEEQAEFLSAQLQEKQDALTAATQQLQAKVCCLDSPTAGQGCAGCAQPPTQSQSNTSQS